MTPEPIIIGITAAVGFIAWAVLAYTAIEAAWREYQDWINRK